jgi:hypothetical protein
MEKLFENLVALFADENVNDVKIDKDEEGNTVILISKKKDNTELQKIRQEIEDLDDEIFEAAAEKLKTSNPTAFKVMMTLEEKNPNMDNIKVAYKIFKAVVKEVVEQHIKEHTEEVNRLFNKYLNNEGE